MNTGSLDIEILETYIIHNFPLTPPYLAVDLFISVAADFFFQHALHYSHVLSVSSA